MVTKGFRFLNVRLASVEKLIRNLTIASDQQWTAMNSEWKRLHKTVRVNYDLVRVYSKQAYLRKSKEVWFSIIFQSRKGEGPCLLNPEFINPGTIISHLMFMSRLISGLFRW